MYARKEGPIAGTVEEVCSGKTCETLPPLAGVGKGCMAMNSDESPLRALAESLKLGEQPSSCAPRMRKPSLDVMVANHLGGGTRTENSSGQLNGIQIDSLGFAGHVSEFLNDAVNHCHGRRTVFAPIEPDRGMEELLGRVKGPAVAFP
jgi:hypothetical protein